MKAVVGKHYVGRSLCSYAVFQWDMVNEHGSTSHTVAKFGSFESAVREMYRLNGWKQPAKVNQRY